MKEADSVLTGRLISREALSLDQVDEMYNLLENHFEGVSRSRFERDLDQKSHAVLIENTRGRIVGFSTLLYYRTRCEGSFVSVVYSGDTIVERAHWGSPVLPKTWIRSVNLLKQSCPKDRLYWLLISSGCRTYRFLPLFWRVFHPRYDLPTPPDRRTLMDTLASERFGTAYRGKEGVVRFDHPQVLRGTLLAVPEGKQENPHVAFFLQRNPGYVHGDELVCLTEIAEENLTSAGRRMWGETDAPA